jgi:predicted RNase H-like HicB family nuclease
MLIRWSDGDGAYIVTLPEFDNAKTHGNTYEAAARQGRDLIESCVMWYQQDGRPLPPPFVFVYPGEDFTVSGQSPAGTALETSVG